MNKYKNKVLSVLLFAFTFFIVHDYVMMGFSDETAPLASVYMSDECKAATISTPDILSDLHDNIHTMLELCVIRGESIFVLASDITPITQETSSTPYVNILPNKPPVV